MYKNYHIVLSALSESFLSYYKNPDNSKPNLTANELSIKLGVNENEVINILFDLKDLKLVSYEKANDSFIIIQNEGITKVKSKYFQFKRNEYKIKRTKEILSIIVSVLAIATFFISVFELNDKAPKEEVNSLKLRLDTTELKVIQIEKNHQSDSLNIRKNNVK